MRVGDPNSLINIAQVARNNVAAGNVKPTKRTPADVAGKAGDADGGRHARQHVEKLDGHRAAIVDLHFFDGCRTSTGPVTFTLPATGLSWRSIMVATTDTIIDPGRISAI